MATLTPVFHAESERIHGEHANLLHSLAELDLALDHLLCYAEVFADLSSAGQVEEHGRLLVEGLPEHFVREEATLLDTVARVSPELASFAAEMKREHQELRLRLAEFGRLLDEFAKRENLDETIWQLKERGKAMTRELGRHVALEEQELSGFL
jgi:hemerythrin-like domain-containing protein